MKIAILEPFKSDVINMPVSMHFLGHENDNGYHSKKVAQTIYNVLEDIGKVEGVDYASQVQVDLFPNVVTGLRYSAYHNYKLLNLSNAYIRSRDPKLKEIEQEVAKKVMLICSAGNEGDEGETETARRGDHWLTVGACSTDGTPKYYSSYGFDAVDIMGIAGQYGWEGTSFSSPHVTAILAVYCLKHKEAKGRYPAPKEMREWAIMKASDVWDEGWDARTGYGLLDAPKDWEPLQALNPQNKRYVMATKDGGRVIPDSNDKELIRSLKKKGYFIIKDYWNRRP